MGRFILGSRPFAPDEAAARLLDPAARDMLARLTSRLQHATWTAGDLEGFVRAFAADEAMGLGKVAQPVRAALTGRSVSPSVFAMMEILGREESLARLADCTNTPATGADAT